VDLCRTRQGGPVVAAIAATAELEAAAAVAAAAAMSTPRATEAYMSACL
jgi:hypothetical protein